MGLVLALKCLVKQMSYVFKEPTNISKHGTHYTGGIRAS